MSSQDGRIIPGDRIMYVNSTKLAGATLDMAVQALKGAPLGQVQIGVCKPSNLDTSQKPNFQVKSCVFQIFFNFQALSSGWRMYVWQHSGKQRSADRHSGRGTTVIFKIELSGLCNRLLYQIHIICR